MKFRRKYDWIKAGNIIIIFSTVVLLVIEIIKSMTLTDILIAVCFCVISLMLHTLVTALSGDYDWIEVDETGITETKLIDILKRNGKQRKFTWEEITDARVSGVGRGGVNIAVSARKEVIIFSFKREAYDCIKQHHPNIILREVNIK